MIIGWPQGIYLVLITLSLGITIAKWGEPQTGTHGWGTIIGVAIVLPLLYLGGFFG